MVDRREELGKKVEDVAREAGYSTKTIARIERGENDGRATKRPQLAKAYGWTPARLTAVLKGVDLAELEEGDWRSNFEANEQSATSMRIWAPMLVPGILQTPAYARAVMSDDELVNRRIRRQRVVNRDERPAKLEVILDESILYRPVGGAEVLAEQLDHIRQMGERDNVTVQVLPLEGPAAGQAIGAFGMFILLTYRWRGGGVYLEHRGGAHQLEGKHDIEAHAVGFAEMQAMALDAKSSRGLIAPESAKEKRAS